MATMIAIANHVAFDVDVDNSGTLREDKIESEIGRIGHYTKYGDDGDDKVSFAVTFFADQRDLVSEIYSFLDPPSLLKLCRGIPFVSNFLTHKHAIGSVTNTLQTETFDLNKQQQQQQQQRVLSPQSTQTSTYPVPQNRRNENATEFVPERRIDTTNSYER